jgi:hypothetical protein
MATDIYHGIYFDLRFHKEMEFLVTARASESNKRLGKRRQFGI